MCVCVFQDHFLCAVILYVPCSAPFYCCAREPRGCLSPSGLRVWRHTGGQRAMVLLYARSPRLIFAQWNVHSVLSWCVGIHVSLYCVFVWAGVSFLGFMFVFVFALLGAHFAHRWVGQSYFICEDLLVLSCLVLSCLVLSGWLLVLCHRVCTTKQSKNKTERPRIFWGGF